MKVKILILDETLREPDFVFSDGHIDVDSITGCYFSNESLIDDSINLFTTAGTITVKRDALVIAMLKEKFKGFYA